jgi:ribonuclease P protein component
MRYTDTLKENYEFRRLYARGKLLKHGSLIIYYRKSQREGNRIGITVNRKIGNAVARNRVRRIIKEGYRMVECEIRRGYDFVFVARARTLGLKSTRISQLLLSMLGDAGLLRPPRE